MGLILGGRYRTKELLDRGGSASVCRASDMMLGWDVAVKVFAPVIRNDKKSRRRRTETVMMTMLHHPALVPLLEAGSHTDNAGATSNYLVMDLIKGEDLRARLSNRPPPPRSMIVRLESSRRNFKKAHQRLAAKPCSQRYTRRQLPMTTHFSGPVYRQQLPHPRPAAGRQPPRNTWAARFRPLRGGHRPSFRRRPDTALPQRLPHRGGGRYRTAQLLKVTLRQYDGLKLLPPNFRPQP